MRLAAPSTPQPSAGLLTAVGLVALGLFLLTAVSLNAGQSPQSEHVAIGFLLGTMFGQTTLAAGWTALGPLPLAWRLPLSLGWIAAITLAFFFNLSLQGGAPPNEELIVLTLGGCLVVQWILAQIPLWCLSLGQGAQFGIRQLLWLTAIVAFILAVGRALVLYLVAQEHFNASESLIFVFLAVAGVIMTLPLLLACLLPRFAVVATAIGLVLIGLATSVELPLVNLVPASPGGPNYWHLLFINLFQALWVVMVMAALRWGGYRLR